MQKKVKQADFYPTLIDLISQAERSVDLYSVSCCFGFYTHGLHNFEKMLGVLWDALRRRNNGRYVDVRLLVKVDRGNPIDLYAAERLVALQRRYKKTIDKFGTKIIVRELPPHCEEVQFAMIDGNEFIGSELQEDSFSEELDIPLNASSPGVRYNIEQNEALYRERSSVFENQWRESAKLNIPTSQISSRRLIYHLNNFRLLGKIDSEALFQLALLSYLQGIYDPSLIEYEFPTGDTRIDLLIGGGPINQRLAIELKFGLKTSGEFDRVIGQIEKYKSKNYSNVVLVVGKPKYTQEQRRYLENKLAELKVGFVEVE